jgi:hypothetical protein
VSKSPPSEVVDLSGVWYATWLSITREREHQATLVIPTVHGFNFTASITVTYNRHGKQTIIEETLTAALRNGTLSLTGVNYTYVQQGNSSSYSLDSFELIPSDEGRRLIGKAVLRNGARDISFTRIRSWTAGV